KISNEYSRIPLHVMARFAGESGISIHPKFYGKEKITSKLSAAEQKINEYVNNIGEKSKAEDWHHNEGWLKKLRHDHLHFSAHLSIAHAPRFRNYQRTRRTYYG
ncbi:MAG: hypothetical protein OEY09_20285, partial [Gammaproteobacteria bacterium]|nr:hypothetical protein [Gammaproteobacteria bacterium]